MPQFKPADRERVKERAKDDAHSVDVSNVGPGLVIVYDNETSKAGITRCYTNLVENYGWYVSSYESDEYGDTAVIMPITEGPSDGA